MIPGLRPESAIFEGGMTLYVHDQSEMSQEKDLLNNPYVRWGLMLVGMAICFLALDILLRRPLLRELALVRHELASVEVRLHDIAGAKDQAWETSNLLSALNAQKKQLEPAKNALTGLREFRQRVEMEAQKTSDAVASLDQMIELQKRVASQHESVANVEQVLSEVVKLHERLLAQKSAQQEAAASLNRVAVLNQQMRDTAKDSETAAVEVQKLGDLRTKVLESSAGVEAALTATAELIALKDTVRKADDVAAVQEAANKLLSLRDSLKPTDNSTEQSQFHTSQLLSLRDEIAASAEDTQVASRNWANVRKLEADMRLAGKDITQSIETLEVLTDLGTELRQQTESIASLRKSLMDVVMLETTIGRVMKVLEPLTQLKTLTRLSDGEIRAAARAIIEQRGTKVTRREAGDSDRTQLKLPHEDELFQDEPPKVLGERLVPIPRDLDDDSEPALPVRTGAAE